MVVAVVTVAVAAVAVAAVAAALTETALIWVFSLAMAAVVVQVVGGNGVVVESMSWWTADNSSN